MSSRHPYNGLHLGFKAFAILNMNYYQLSHEVFFEGKKKQCFSQQGLKLMSVESSRGPGDEAGHVSTI
jgi:hypothetical protein